MFIENREPGRPEILVRGSYHIPEYGPKYGNASIADSEEEEMDGNSHYRLMKLRFLELLDCMSSLSRV